MPGHVVGSGRARCWGAHERWLDLAEFGAELRKLPYSSMLNCESWQVGGAAAGCSPAVLPRCCDAEAAAPTGPQLQRALAAACSG